MFYVILFVLFGILIGRYTRRVAALRCINSSVSLTVGALLVVLGWAVGGDGALLRGIGRWGGEALLLCAAGVLGSALAAWVFVRLMGNGRGEEVER